MPIYEYRCEDCEQIFEEWQKDFKEQDVPCPVCGAKSNRLISNTSFILKGSGWYVTDYCKRGDSSTASSSGGESAAADAAGNGNGNGNGSSKAAKPEAAKPEAAAPSKGAEAAPSAPAASKAASSATAD